MAALILTKFNRSLVSRSLWVLLYLFFICLPFIIEHILTNDEVACGQFGRLVRISYHLLSSPGYRKPRAHYVHLVSIQEGEDPPIVVTDNCPRRQYLTKLIPALALQQPAVIVLDFSPSPPGNCPAEIDEALRKSITQASQHVPIVVGEEADDYDDLPSDQKESLKKQGFGKNDLLLEDPGWIENGSSPEQSRYGLTTLLCDNRALPLRWNVFVPGRTKQGLYSRHAVDTLSMAAAKAYEGTGELSLLQGIGIHKNLPFTSFLPEEKFERTPAIQVMCPKSANTSDWKECDYTGVRLPHLRARILVVGLGRNPMRSDYHPSIINEISGYIFQANYIEALLDDRLLWSVSPWLQLLLSVILFCFIQLIFFLSKSWVKALTVSMMLVAGCFLACLLLALEMGWYLDFWLSGIFIPFLALYDRLKDKVGVSAATDSASKAQTSP